MLPVTILIVFDILTYCQGHPYSSDNIIISNIRTEPATIEEYRGEEWIAENERRGGADTIQPDTMRPDNNGGYAQTWWEPQTGYQYNEDNMAEENDDPIAHAAAPVVICPQQDKLPTSAIVYMVLNNNILGEQMCTGIFIQPKTILTAAHCVIDNGNKFTPSIIQRQKGCSPSTGGVAKHCDMYTAEYVHPHPHYRKWEYDYAIIITNKESPAWIWPEGANCAKYIQENLVVLGYPDTDAKKRMHASKCPLLRVVRKCKSIAMEYSCGTIEGMSGGPIFDYTNGAMIGVHTAGDDGKGKKVDDDYGICITKTVQDLLVKWILKYKGSHIV